MIKGKLLIITAPSGAGKTTIVRHLLRHIPSLAFSVSATTRPPRENETHGVDYYFLSEEEFRQGIEKEEFAEWEEVYPGRFYGTLKKEMERKWEEGKTVVFDIDVKGALNLQRQFRDESLSLFIAPPSREALRKRLEGRGTENAETLEVRMERASMELTQSRQFDTVIINDDLELAKQKAMQAVSSFLHE